MEKVLLLLFFLLLLNVQGQSDKNVERSQVQLSLPFPSVLFENAVYKNITASFEAVADLPLQGLTTSENNFNLYPVLRGQLRFYHNTGRRLEKKKNISGNSGNYIAGLIVFQQGHPLVGTIFTGTTIGVGPVYGIQRTFGREHFYRFEGGVAYVQNDFESSVGFVFAVRVGWTFRKKERK